MIDTEALVELGTLVEIISFVEIGKLVDGEALVELGTLVENPGTFVDIGIVVENSELVLKKIVVKFRI